MGLSTITFIVNGFFLWGILCWREGRSVRRPATPIVVSLFLLTVGGILETPVMKSPHKIAQILVVQANISNNDKEYAEHGGGTSQFVVDKFLNLTAKALAGAKEPPTLHFGRKRLFPTCSPNLACTIACNRNSGLFTIEEFGPGDRRLRQDQPPTHQCDAALNGNGTIACPSYSKTSLAGVWRVLPWRRLVSRDEKMGSRDCRFGRGGGPQLFHLSGIKLGAQICYEGLFDRFVEGTCESGRADHRQFHERQLVSGLERTLSASVHDAGTRG